MLRHAPSRCAAVVGIISCSDCQWFSPHLPQGDASAWVNSCHDLAGQQSDRCVPGRPTQPCLHRSSIVADQAPPARSDSLSIKHSLPSNDPFLSSNGPTLKQRPLPLPTPANSIDVRVVGAAAVVLPKATPSQPSTACQEVPPRGSAGTHVRVVRAAAVVRRDAQQVGMREQREPPARQAAAAHEALAGEQAAGDVLLQ